MLGIVFAVHLTAMAADTTWQEDFTYTKSGNSILLSKYNGSATDLTVPATAVIDGTNYSVKLDSDCSLFFYGRRNLKTVTFASGVDTGSVTNMYRMLGECSNLTSVSGLTDTGNVTTMQGMFRSCSSLTSIGGIGSWDTGKVENLGGMFNYCYSLTSLDLHAWITKNVTQFSEMFVNCRNLTSLNLQGWDTRSADSVNGLYAMFSGCRSLTA